VLNVFRSNSSKRLVFGRDAFWVGRVAVLIV
jgi:hypothetical protein